VRQTLDVERAVEGENSVTLLVSKSTARVLERVGSGGATIESMEAHRLTYFISLAVATSAP